MEASETPQECSCLSMKNDLEVSSVYSDEFSDATSTHNISEALDIEGGSMNVVGKMSKEPASEISATDCLYIPSCEVRF